MIYNHGFNVCDLVLVPFPFSNLENFKKRPAIIIYKSLKIDDVLVIPVTSTSYHIDSEKITNNDLAYGELDRDSNILYMKMFTISANQIIRKIGTIKRTKILSVVGKMKETLDSNI